VDAPLPMHAKQSYVVARRAAATTAAVAASAVPVSILTRPTFFLSGKKTLRLDFGRGWQSKTLQGCSGWNRDGYWDSSHDSCLL